MRKAWKVLALAVAFVAVFMPVALVQAPPDNAPPTIETPTVQPTAPNSSYPVTVSVVVTDKNSGVKNVTVAYTTDNWQSVNNTLTAAYNATSETATVQIPALEFGGSVSYYVVAFDNAGNMAVNDNDGVYFTYAVAAPSGFSSLAYLAIGLGLAAGIGAFVVVMLRSRSPGKQAAPGPG